MRVHRTRPTVFTFPNLMLALAVSFVGLIAWPGIQKNYLPTGAITQPTAIVVPTRAAPPANNPPLPTAVPAAVGSPPDVMPTPAPLEAAPAAASGLTESMERKFEEAANPGIADRILDTVESWSEATPAPDGSPPVDNGGGKELGRKVDGGTSGGKTWAP